MRRILLLCSRISHECLDSHLDYLGWNPYVSRTGSCHGTSYLAHYQFSGVVDMIKFILIWTLTQQGFLGGSAVRSGQIEFQTLASCEVAAEKMKGTDRRFKVVCIEAGT